MGKPRVNRSQSESGIESSLLKVPQFCCEFAGCRKYFSKLSRLQYHQNTHLPEKPYKCEVEGCTSAYYRPYHLKRHVDSAHKSQESSKDHRCPHDECGAAFESESSLYFHTKKKHSVQPFQCSICEKKFSKRWMYKEHQASHTGAKPFECDFESCKATFIEYKRFKAHKRGHEKNTGEKKKLYCSVEECKLPFVKWSELVIHKKLCHPPETKCSICKKTFPKYRIKRHMEIHQEERTVFQCPFDGCPRFYLHQRNLSHHMRIQHEDMRFNCTLCDRKLSSKQKLDSHIQLIHEGKAKRRKRKKVQKSLPSILNKLEAMKPEDWEVKRTGPARYQRNTSLIRFPEVSSDKNKEQKTEISGQHVVDSDSTGAETEFQIDSTCESADKPEGTLD